MSLREKAERATKGPWEVVVEYNGDDGTDYYVAPGWRCGEMTEEIHCGDDKAVAEFIAAADPPTVLALLDRAEKAEAELVHAERCWTDLGNDVLENAPDWFDGDEDQDGIAVRYVRWLEDRVAELERGDADRG